MKRLLLVLCLALSTSSVSADVTDAIRVAEQGHASAQYRLGLLYGFGEGVPQNYAEAAKWYRLAAEQGHASAQYRLGILYILSRGVPQNFAEAAKWYRLAAEQGHALAQFRLGQLYGLGEGVPENYSEAYIWFSLAAASGDEDAIHHRDIAVKKLSPEALASAQKRSAKLFEEIEARKSANE